MWKRKKRVSPDKKGESFLEKGKKLAGKINGKEGRTVRKITVIIITHNSAIAPMADKVIKFKSGKVEEIKINKKPVDIERIEW